MKERIDKLQTANERCKFIAELALSAQCNKREYETALGIIIDIADVNEEKEVPGNKNDQQTIQLARFRNMRVEVLLDKNNKSLSSTVLQALEKELKTRVTAHYPDAKFRIAESSNTNIQVLGANPEDRDKVMQIIQELWESSDWVPEEV